MIINGAANNDGSMVNGIGKNKWTIMVMIAIIYHKKVIISICIDHDNKRRNVASELYGLIMWTITTQGITHSCNHFPCLGFDPDKSGNMQTVMSKLMGAHDNLG